LTPGGRSQSGQVSLSMIKASLGEAQLLQNSIKGTAQDTPAVQAAITAQVNDLQQLVANVQGVVQNGTSFTLGAVGGVNITVTPNNIADVDRLILATLNQLAANSAGTTSARKGAAQGMGTSCLAQESAAIAQAMLAGSGNFDSLAQQFVGATRISVVCRTLAAFASAYQIFAGAGAIGIGITDQAGGSLVANNLPGSALFGLLASNINVQLGLNAVLNPAYSAQVLQVQNVVGTVTALAQPAITEVVGKSTGAVAANLNDSNVAINIVAPPPLLSPPGNILPGVYTMSTVFCTIESGQTNCQNLPGSQMFTIATPSLFATQIDSVLTAACNQYGGDEPDPAGPDGDEGFVCSSAYSSFNGSQFKVVLTVTGPGVTYVLTYTLVKTG
jgi:hypothetical protein